MADQLDNITDPAFVREQYATQDNSNALAFPIVPTNAVTSINGVTGPTVTLAGGTSGFSYAPGGSTLTLVSPLTTKGDLYVRNATTGTRLPVGVVNGDVLTVDSAQATGLKYATPTTGTVTTVSVVSANGFAGSVANPTTAPAITLSTTITGILSGNGTAISAASVTGSGSVVLATSPTLVTPVLGVASATSINFGDTALAKYKEGTFTPGLSFGGGTTGITYGAQAGFYTHFGDLVYVQFRVSLTNKGSSTGAALITGMPVNGSTTASQLAMFAIYFDTATYTGTPFAYMQGAASTTDLQLIVQNNGTVTTLADTNFQNTSTIFGTLIYRSN